MRTILFLSIILLSGCTFRANKIIGQYWGSCYINTAPNVILTIDSSRKFSYHLAYLNDKIEGNWQIKKDTLFLFSSWFKEKPVDLLEPIHKITDLKEMDAFIIKKNRLYVISLHGVTKDCYLKKQQASE